MPGEPSLEEWQQAETLLRRYPEYRPITESEKPFYTTSEAGDLLGLSDHVMRATCKRGEIHGAVEYRGAGWRIPRSGLLVFCAQRLRGEHVG